jgi:hypothetical protein
MWQGPDGWHQCLKLKGHTGIHEKVGKHACKPSPDAKLFKKIGRGKPGESLMVELDDIKA